MQSLNWYVNRLGRMSAGELAYRIGQAALATQDRLTRSYEAAVPVAETFGTTPQFIRTPSGLAAQRYVEQADALMAGRFAIFDLEVDLGAAPEWNRDPLTKKLAPLEPAAGLDYRDERIVGNIKYLWEPNRHLHIVAFAQAFALTRDSRYAHAIRAHVSSWMDECPAGRGPNWCSSLELAIRLINWSLAWQLLGGASSPLFADAEGRAFRDRWCECVYRHVRMITRKLSRFSSANNHLIGETAGVWIASVTWDHWPEVRRWGERCKSILEQEFLKQNAADGVNREQAFSYQQFVLDFGLLAGLAARAVNRDFCSAFWTRIEAMTDFLASVMDVGGHVPMIGDADDGYVAKLSADANDTNSNYHSLIATGAVLFRRADLARKAERFDDKSRWLLGDEGAEAFASLVGHAPTRYTGTRAFPHAGYYLLGDRYETRDEVKMVVDAGPLGYLSIAAHGHADALSFVLSVGGEEILVDPGTYAYHTAPQWRRHFRSTRAHNTVLVDDRDQSEQSGNFMWSRHANARCLEFLDELPVQKFVGEHDGYRVLRDPLTHRREIEYDSRQRRFTITDTLECKSHHRVRLHWHCAESLQPLLTDREVCLYTDRHCVKIVADRAPDRVLSFRAGTSSEGGWVSRGFGRKEPATTLAWESEINGTTVFRTHITVEDDADCR